MHTHRTFRFGIVLLLALVAGGASAQAQRHAKPARIFDEKSGVVEMKMSMMGMEPKMTLYFDDYGNKTATVVQLDMMGQTVTQRMVKIGNVTTQWNDQTMEGTRTVGRSGDGMSLTAYVNMSPERKRSLNYRELESRDVAGKTANGFSIDTSEATMKIWQWRNIPVYMEAEMQGMNVVFEATAINVPSAVPASTFVVPKNVKIEKTGVRGASPRSNRGGVEIDENALTTPKTPSR